MLTSLLQIIYRAGVPGLLITLEIAVDGAGNVTSSDRKELAVTRTRRTTDKVVVNLAYSGSASAPIII